MPNPDLRPQPLETWPQYVRRVWPSLANFEYDGPQVTQAEAQAFMLDHLAALVRLFYDGDDNAVVRALLHCAHRGHTAHYVVQRLMAESQLTAAERRCAECDTADSSLGSVEDEHDNEGAERLDVEDAEGFLDAERDEGGAQ